MIRFFCFFMNPYQKDHTPTCNFWKTRRKLETKKGKAKGEVRQGTDKWYEVCVKKDKANCHNSKQRQERNMKQNSEQRRKMVKALKCKQPIALP